MSRADVAVRIKYNVSESSYDWQNWDFYEDEVGIVNTPPDQKYLIQKAQMGNPTIKRLGSRYDKVVIEFINEHADTLQKLKNIRDWTADGGRLLVYPVMRADSDIYYDCLLQPNSIPDRIGFKGFDKARDRITVTFLEFQKEAAIAET